MPPAPRLSRPFSNAKKQQSVGAAIFAAIIRDGVAAGEIAPQDEELLATAIVGAIAETLVGPLSRRPRPEQEEALVEGVKRFCVQALGPPPPIETATGG